MAAAQAIPEPQHIDELIYTAADFEDIMDVILMVFQKHQNDLQSLAPRLRSYRGKIQTLRNVWQYAHDRIKYVPDKEGNERVKSPAKTHSDRYGDCKSFTIYIGALLHALNIPFVFRLAETGHQRIKHIYPVALLGGRSYVVDATLNQFDYEAPTTSAVDYQPYNGDIATIRGFSFKIGEAPKNILKTTMVIGVGYFIFRKYLYKKSA